MVDRPTIQLGQVWRDNGGYRDRLLTVKLVVSEENVVMCDSTRLDGTGKRLADVPLHLFKRFALVSPAAASVSTSHG